MNKDELIKQLDIVKESVKLIESQLNQPDELVIGKRYRVRVYTSEYDKVGVCDGVHRKNSRGTYYKFKGLNLHYTYSQVELAEPEVLPYNAWYLSGNGSVVYFTKECSGYGINNTGLWFNSDNWPDLNIPNYWTTLSASEVHERLTAYDIKAGYKEGVKIKSLDNGIIRELKSNKPLFYPSCCFGINTLTMGGWMIFKDGQWAEIIKDEPIKIGGYDLKINGYYAELGYKKIHIAELRSIKDFMNRNEFKSCQFDGHSFTLEQVKSILKKLEG